MAKERLIHKKEKPLSFDVGFPPSSNTNGIANNKAMCWEARWRLWGLKNWLPGFPGGTVVKNLPANSGDTGSSPGLGRSHMPWSN